MTKNTDSKTKASSMLNKLQFKKIVEFPGRIFKKITKKKFVNKNKQEKKSQDLNLKQKEDKFTPKLAPNSWHAKHPKVVKFFYILFYPLINPYFRSVAILLLLLIVVSVIYLFQHLPSPKKLIATDSYDTYAVSTQILDRNGELLYEIYADINRIPINIEDLPDHVIQATIAIEDKNFYKHMGLDPEGIFRAIRNNLFAQKLEGGSTITQQLVKNALLTPERSFARKFNEALLAILTEVVYSKDEILEMYLNYISYGGTSVGIEAAAQSYFGKPAKDLSLEEAALIASLPQAPTKYSPFGSNPERAKQRQAEVLRRMVEEGFITQSQAEKAGEKPLTYALSQTEIKAPHFVFFVRDLLYEKYGVDKVEKGGLRVYTTLDLETQRAAQKIVSEEVAGLERYRASNGAALISKPNTGEILAMIGSKDYFNIEDEGQVNVTISLRQPGSAIKPIMYATTFQEKTLNPGTLILDTPTCFQEPYQRLYCPRNYDGGFRGIVTIRQALGNSFNIPAVKALATIGVKPFIDQATSMGISTWTDPAKYGLSLTLGGGEVKMTDMAQAFGTLANQGVIVPLTPILRVETYSGEILEETDFGQRINDLEHLTNYESLRNRGDLQRVMERAPAYLASHIMQDNHARTMIFGTHSQLVIPGHIVSAKTGTTNDLKDNWTIGFTPEFLVTTWVGNNDSTPMNYLASGIVGAAPMFNDLMTYILTDKESIWQEKPSDVLSGGVCANGMPPQFSTEPCEVMNNDMFWNKSKPSNSSFSQQNVWINPETGQPPEHGEEIHGLQLEERVMLQDPVTHLYCYDCNLETNEEGTPVYGSQTIMVQDGKVIRQ
jgi:penicillin-binding protein 1C